MLSSELFETAENDLRNLRRAQRAAGLFSEWLNLHNADTPIRDCMQERQVESQSKDLPVWLLRASDAGIDDDHLWFGLLNDPANSASMWTTQGYTSELPGMAWPERLERTPVFLMINLREEPADLTDVAFKLEYSELIHELTHVFNYRDGYLRHRANIDRHRFNKPKWDKIEAARRNPALYYNRPIEFNGYFQQGLHGILYSLAIGASSLDKRDEAKITAFRQNHLSSYRTFRQYFQSYFDSNWRHFLNSQNQRKLDRRLAKLYMLVQKTWPDMAAIRDIEAQNTETNARRDAREQKE